MTRPMALTLAAALTALAGTASAYNLYRATDDDSGPPLRWFSLSAELTFDTQAPQEISQTVAHDVILGSFRNWSGHACGSTPTDYGFESAGFVPGRQVGYDPDAAANENLVVWVTSSSRWHHGPGVVALTSLTFDVNTGEVVDADLELNDAEFRFSASAPGPLPHEMDLENAVAHEAGHFLGLDHSNGKLATMYKNAKPGEVIKRDPNQDDIDGFCALYGPNAIPIPEPTAPPGAGGCSAAPASGGAPLVGLVSLVLVALAGLRCASRAS